jgi:phosphate starvation-inducible protein PhoH and related proteins
LAKRLKDDEITTLTFHFRNDVEAVQVLGVADGNLRIIQQNTPARVVPRGSSVRISGPRGEVALVQQLLGLLVKRAQAGDELSEDDIERFYNQERSKESEEEHTLELVAEEEIAAGPVDRAYDNLVIDGGLIKIRPRTTGQADYVRAMKENAITFCAGPAGTGKTYLAVAMAVNYLSRGIVQRIILTRPAIEAGESLGFLPGTFQEKVDPYFRPLYDALYEMLGVEKTRRLTEREVIEIAPLAYMRGRTLNKSFIILDEAQNTTARQMKMFLTRMGPRSRMVITGDPSQVDLPTLETSGLAHALNILSQITGIAFTRLDERDIVRHSLVQQIVEAYEESEGVNKKHAGRKEPPRRTSSKDES